MLGLLCVLLISILSLSFVSAMELSSFENDLFEGEPLVASFCGGNANLSLECMSQAPTQADGVEDCSYFSFPTSSVTCDMPLLRATPKQDSQPERINILSPEEIMREELDSLKKTDPVSVATKIYAYSVLGNTSKFHDQLDVLKNSRDEDRKCWPAEDCAIEDTVEVLYFLHKAGLNSSSRVYKDALLWVESHQYPYDLEQWSVEFEADNGTECSIAKDGSQGGSCKTSKKEECSIEFDFASGTSLNASCEDDYCVHFKDKFDQDVYKSCREEDEKVSIVPYGGCFHYTDKPYECPTGLTEKVLLLDGLSKEVHADAISWLDDKIEEAAVAGNRLTTTPEVYANLYAYNSHDDSRLLSWILYSQNNEGSFGEAGEQNTFYLTLEALEILQESSSSNEWYRDAREWVLDESFHGALDSLKEATLFKEFFIDKQFFYIDKGLIVSEQASINTTIETGSDIDVSLEKYLFDLEVTNDTDQVNVTITDPRWESFGIREDTLKISSEAFTREYPVIFKNIPYLNMENSTHDVYKHSPSFDVPVDPSHKMVCTVSGDNILTDSFSLKPATDKLSLKANRLPTGISRINLSASCSVDDYSFTDTVPVVIRHHPDHPFTVKQEVLTEGVTELTVKNNFNETISVSLSLDNPEVAGPTMLTIAPLSSNTVNLKNPQANVTTNATFSARSYSKTHTIRFDGRFGELFSDNLSLIAAGVFAIALFGMGIILKRMLPYLKRQKGQHVDVDNSNDQSIPAKNLSKKVSYSTTPEPDGEAEATVESDTDPETTYAVNESDKRLSRLLYAFDKALSAEEEVVSDFTEGYTEEQKKELYEDAQTYFESEDDTPDSDDNEPEESKSNNDA